MPYQLKLEVLSKPKKQLAPAERKAVEAALNDATIFLENTLRAAMQKHRKTGKTEASIRKLVFRIKLSSKVFFDLKVAPHALYLMRGNKRPRTITAHGEAMRFTIQGQTLYRKSVKIPRTFGLRYPEKMRNSIAVRTRLQDIFVAHIKRAMGDGKTQLVITAPVLIR